MTVWPLRHKDRHSLSDVRLLGEAVMLRPAIVDDYPAWADVRSRNQPYLKPFEPTWPSNALSRDFFNRRVAKLEEDKIADRTYAFLIFDLEESNLIGGININNVTRGAAQYGTLGYWLDRESQGRGYMTQAGFLVLGYAFNVLKLMRMNAGTLVHNQKSRELLLRLGFVEEGFAKAYIQIDGRRQDHILYGLNASDFHR